MGGSTSWWATDGFAFMYSYNYMVNVNNAKSTSFETLLSLDDNVYHK